MRLKTKWLLVHTAITATATTTNTAAAAAFHTRAVTGPVHTSRTIACTRTRGRLLSPPPFINSAGGRGLGAQRRLHSTFSRTSLFESMRNGYYRNTNSDEIGLDNLLEKAASVRSKWGAGTGTSLTTTTTFPNLQRR